MNRLTLLPLLAIPALAAGVAVAGCGTTDSQGATPKTTTPASTTAAAPAAKPAASAAQDGTVEVKVDEWHVTPAAASAPHGKVTFAVTNAGKAPHELVVLRTTKGAADLGTGSQVPEKGHMGEVEDLKPGATKHLTLKLPAGHYSLICNMPGHYMSGMHADFTVS